MRKIAHISDLHFGTEEPDVTEGLLNDLGAIRPDIIIVSGDLTQRGRTSQFRSARDFLDKLNTFKLVIPGNHDIPLFNLFKRFFSPLKNYLNIITGELNPFYEDSELAVLGLNTARSLTWKEGRISYEQMKLIEEKMCKVDNNKFKIIVTHHPFLPPPGILGITLVGRSGKAMKIIDKCEIDLLMAGHIHLGYSGDVKTYYPAENRSLISVNAGTAISHRQRGQKNAYNALTVSSNKIVIEIRIWDGFKFVPQYITIYNLKDKEWVREL
jgi:3',5'-cyclic AMP phosphodiesterase CpdA